MRKTKWMAVPFSFFIAFISLTSQDSKQLEMVSLYLKHETPEAVMETMFEAAQTGVFDQFGGLCDPQKENDGDTDCICAIDEKYVPHKCSESQKKEINAATFVEYFKLGKFTGAPEISGDRAKIDFVFGPQGDIEETMYFIRRGNFWYLSWF